MRLKSYKITSFLLVAIVSAFSGSATAKVQEPEYDKAKLFITLPTEYNTPDGAALDINGNIILSIPNFNNDHLIESGELMEPSPPVMAKIDENNEIETWYQFQAEDMHPETGRIGPMDAAFGPDGNLYVADMQIFWSGEHKSRLLRINMKNGQPADMDVVVEGFIVANGVTWKGNTLFVSETILAHTPKTKKGKQKPALKSGVYAFTLDELQNDLIKLLPYSENGADEHLVVQFESSNRVGFGADGVTIDAAGNLYTSIMEDGVIYKTKLDSKNRAIKTKLFAKDKNMVSADGIVWNPVDNHIYVADFLGNATHAIDTKGHVTTLHKNGDTNGADGSLDQPCEVIIRGSELIIVNMDMAWAVPENLLVNTEVDQPYTISVIQLEKDTPNKELGKSIFFDLNLSIDQNQSCAACHAPEVGWTGPISDTNAFGAVYEGSIFGRFGNRKPPSAAYATVSPVFHLDKKGLFVGGNFWDGRATGEKLGNPATDQAQGPFLNPVEQALPDSACIVYRVCNPVVPGDYPVSFEDVWGDEACDIDWPADIDTVCATDGATVALSSEDRAKSDMNYDYVALSIAAYEASPEVNAFTSKFDYSKNGKAQLSKEEQKGFAIFKGKGKCRLCHISTDRQPFFTDFTFDNLGVPKNPENPVYDVDPDFIDLGLGGFLMNTGYPAEVYEAEMGKQKVPTLRNVDLRPDEDFAKAYAHNGYFKTLEGIVHFYNTRDVKPVCPGDYTEAEALDADCWPPPEVPENVNTDELGNLGLSPEEEAAIVAFLKALSDGFPPPE